MRSNLPLIISREYTTRVFRLSFIIVSLLIPIGMAILMVTPALIAMAGSEGSSNIAVLDQTTQRYSDGLEDDEAATFTIMPNSMSENDLRQTYEESGFDAYLVIAGTPTERDSARLCSKNKISLEAIERTERCLKDAVRRDIIRQYAGQSAELDSVFDAMNQTKAVLTTIDIAKDGSDSESFAELGSVISILSGMLIYAFVLITGSMVMQAVAEEKHNRIVEVIVSSVRPFELMLGKIIGIGLVALTQIAIWAALGTALSIVLSVCFGIEGTTDPSLAPQGAEVLQSDPNIVANILHQLQAFNFLEIGILFVVYFLGGYLVYAALFAITGAITDPRSGDGNQLTIIIMIPIFASTYIALHTMQDPNSSLSFWSSIFPLTSPIIMMTRVPAGNVPLWEILTSLVLLAGTIVGLVWMAGRIYRVGILMYGKKISAKEIWHWFRQAE